jgi:hypothetical protein
MRARPRQATPARDRRLRTKKEAQAALNDALSGVQRGTFVAPSRTTVRDFLELWLDGVKTEVALTAWVSYRQAVRRLHQPTPRIEAAR